MSPPIGKLAKIIKFLGWKSSVFSAFCLGFCSYSILLILVQPREIQYDAPHKHRGHCPCLVLNTVYHWVLHCCVIATTRILDSMLRPSCAAGFQAIAVRTCLQAHYALCYYTTAFSRWWTCLLIL